MHQKRQTPPSRAELEDQIARAWEHYWIAMRSYSAGLPVDWEHALFKVMICLTPGGEDAGYDAVQAALDELGEIEDVIPRRPVKTTRHP